MNIISKYADEFRESPNCNDRGDYTVCKLTPHHTGCANPTIAGIDSRFLVDDPVNGASANYVIMSDGYCICYVPENKRAWTSGGAKTSLGMQGWENDYQAVTVEIANSGEEDEGWTVSQEAYDKFIKLAIDICQRWAFELNYTGESDGTLTNHQMFSYTTCPGPYLLDRMVVIEQEVNDGIHEKEEDKMTREEKEMMIRMECNEWLHRDPDAQTLNDLCELIPNDAEYDSFNTSAIDDMLEHSEEGNHLHRIEAIKSFYRTCLGREASDAEAYGWATGDDASLRKIYKNIYNSDEANAYRKRKFNV